MQLVASSTFTGLYPSNPLFAVDIRPSLYILLSFLYHALPLPRISSVRQRPVIVQILVVAMTVSSPLGPFNNYVMPEEEGEGQ